MNNKSKSIFIFLSVVVFVLVFSLLISLFIPVAINDTEKRIVYVKYGSGFKQISVTLEKEGLLRSRFLFEVYVWASNKYKNLKAGEYEFTGSDSMYVIADKLIKGAVIKHKVVVPEGSDIYDIAKVLSDNSLVNKDRFLILVKDTKFLKSIGIPYKSAEGFLFPDTYSFIIGEGEERIIKAMYKRFVEQVPLNLKSRYSPGGKTLTGYSILKMASIIEKESKLDAERPLVASVFYNRMKEIEAYKKRLESCATVRYGLNKKTGALRERHLKIDTPYNSYIYIGLPPTPICNPGLKSIQAALKPASTKYRYFVVETEGAHTFSETLEEHNSAKRRNKRNNR